MQHFSEIHATALAYAEAGIPVFPCLPDDKAPATKNGFHDATTDIEKINVWWKENPNYNLAICPEDAGLFIVDIDPGADPAFMKNLPLTYSVRTPRGGYHFYFEGSGPSTVRKLAQYVDTRGVGGYVLVPPSIVQGKPYYAWTEEPYAPVPPQLLEALAVTSAPLKAAVEERDLPTNIKRAEKVLLEYVKRDDVAREGMGGDDRTYRLCCELLDLGLSVGTAKTMIEDMWNPHCIPPWSSEEIDIKLENAEKFQQNEGGAYAIEAPQDVFGDTVKKITPPEKLSRFHFKDEEELDQETDPKWLVKELISEASTVMMYGASGSYKSFMALDICLAIATGKQTFGSNTQPGLVFYGALEGKAHLRKGRKAWRIVKEIEGKIENFFVGRAPFIAIDEEVQEFGDEIRKRCGDRKPSLIVIDTLSKSMAGMNENDAADANKFVIFCDSLVEAFGCTVMAIHHSGHEAKRARGSSAFFAGFDTVIEVTAHKATKAVTVRVEKHKDAEEREQPWTFEGRITGPSLTFEMTTPEQHRMLVGESKDITPKKVGAALKELSAFGDMGAITTAVLATQLTVPRENESVEERGIAIARTSRALNAMAKDVLEAYCAKAGRGVVWYLPAPQQLSQ